MAAGDYSLPRKAAHLALQEPSRSPPYTQEEFATVPTLRGIQTLRLLAPPPLWEASQDLYRPLTNCFVEVSPYRHQTH